MGRMALLITLVLSLASGAWTAPLRTAAVGDRMGALTVGLKEVTLDTGLCRTPLGAVPLRRIGYIVPGREPNEENASVVGLVLLTGQIAVLATFDETNMDDAVTIYADREGNGLVTDVWAAEGAPMGCAIIGTLRYLQQGMGTLRQ